jgi:hypothetical protein
VQCHRSIVPKARAGHEKFEAAPPWTGYEKYVEAASARRKRRA